MLKVPYYDGKVPWLREIVGISGVQGKVLLGRRWKIEGWSTKV